MPRVRLDVADRDRTARGESGVGFRLDTDVLAAVGNSGASTAPIRRPRIERWLACWSRDR